MSAYFRKTKLIFSEYAHMTAINAVQMNKWLNEKFAESSQQLTIDIYAYHMKKQLQALRDFRHSQLNKW